MATKFKKGDQVKVPATAPQGPVQALRMDDDGTVYCLVQWTDAENVSQERWFKEDDLIGA